MLNKTVEKTVLKYYFGVKHADIGFILVYGFHPLSGGGGY